MGLEMLIEQDFLRSILSVAGPLGAVYRYKRDCLKVDGSKKVCSVIYSTMLFGDDCLRVLQQRFEVYNFLQKVG